jgi:hypothetical protein
MKKLMFALALTALVTAGATAQKQMGDEHNIEVSFSPLSGSPIDATVIKYRNFLDDNRAFRLSFMLNNNSDTYVTAQEGFFSEEDPVSPQLHDIYGSTSFGIAPGYEMHFDGTDNLSPYFAIEGYFMMGKNSYEQEFWGANDIENIGQLEKYVTWSYTTSQGYNRIGLNLLFGADYYFTDMMYVGFEAGLGFGSTSVSNFEFSISDLVAYNLEFDGAPNDDAPVAVAGTYDEFDLYNGTTALPMNPGYLSTSTLGNVFQGSLRLGFLFQ